MTGRMRDEALTLREFMILSVFGSALTALALVVDAVVMWQVVT